MLPKTVSLIPLLSLILGACSLLSHPSEKDLARAENYFNAGVAFFEDKSYAESLQAFEEAARLSPQDSNIEMHRALALFKVGREEQALDILQKTCPERPEFPECYNNYSQLLILKRHYLEGLQAADKALASPTYSSPDFARVTKGLALHHLGRHQEAITTWKSVHEPNRPLRCRISLYLSRSSLALANFSEASRHARIGRDLCENDPHGPIWMAYVQYRLGEIDDARSVLTEAIRTFRTPEARDQARVMLNRLNREEVLAEPSLFL